MGDREQELSEVCGGLNQLHARLVDLVASALADDGWAGDGVRSPEHWLILRAGLSKARASQLVRVAARRAELPTLMGAFDDGQLSFEQVATVTQHAPARMEASVTELALNATVPQLSRSLSRYSFEPAPPPPTDEDGSEEELPEAQPGPDVPESPPGPDLAEAQPGLDPQERASEPAELSMTYDESGRFQLRLDAPADLGALVEAALQEARDALFQAKHPHVTWATALSEVCERSLTAPASAGRRKHFQVLVHLDTDGGWLNSGPALPRHLLEKLTCEGSLRPLWETEGQPINVGRAFRIAPDRTRRLVEDRDRGCRFPGCVTTVYLENHHVITWADGGATDSSNLCCLCPWHHDRLHAGDYSLSGNADDPHGLAFTDRRGFPITGPRFRTPPGRPPGPGQPVATDGPPAAQASALAGQSAAIEGRTGNEHAGVPDAAAYGGPTGETLYLKWVSFTASADSTDYEEDPSARGDAVPA